MLSHVSVDAADKMGSTPLILVFRELRIRLIDRPGGKH
jgi:hypothetical protein